MITPNVRGLDHPFAVQRDRTWLIEYLMVFKTSQKPISSARENEIGFLC